MSFPANPTVDQQHTFNGRVYVWTGQTWNLFTTGNVGATGPQGATGPSGTNGATGPQGASGPAGIDGATGPQGPTGVAGASGATGPAGPLQANPVYDLGTVTGSNAINFASDRFIQTLTLDGTATTFTKGTGWPTEAGTSVDIGLKITVSALTTITWSIVNEWYAQPPSGALAVGTHLFFLRANGTTIEGHYVGSRTN